jgi:branched-subunit amino acid aminotransferase/4-amino-4-deoxychorismate lyase
MSGDIAWVDGSFRGKIDPFDRGATLGDGVFDTLRRLFRRAFRG